MFLFTAKSGLRALFWPNTRKEKRQNENLCGWFSPAMAEHWERWLGGMDSDGVTGKWYSPHDIKNLLAEWIEDDAQRAARILSIIIVLQWLTALLHSFV
jgi:hypothetical protein